jgi:hypothetical protein
MTASLSHKLSDLIGRDG